MQKTIKKTITMLSLLITVLMITTACSESELTEGERTGIVRLDINTLTSTNTRALNKETYNPQQLAVVIKNDSGDVIKQTDDYTEWKDEEITLPVGHYTLTASSNGFDGNESGFDIPYYSGQGSFTVGENTLQTVSVTCTLATVKVTVNFTDRFKSVFQAAHVSVSSSVDAITPLDFVMSDTYDSSIAGYFPVGNISAKISVTSANGDFSSIREFANVKARDHYILTYDVSESGNSTIIVSADASGNTYTYNINVADFGHVLIDAADLGGEDAGNVWSNKVLLSGSLSGLETFDIANVSFEYKSAVEDAYHSIHASLAEAKTRAVEDSYRVNAQLGGLTPDTRYSYRLVYDDGIDRYTSTERTFITESQTPLFNGSMDEWYQRPASGFTRRAQWFACSSEYFAANGTWWDSSNRGTTEGAGWLANRNPTTSESTIVHTQGGKAARLASTSAINIFAAASLYAGTFNSLQGTSGAKLDWGRPFTSRPVALKGWFRYDSGIIDYVGNNTPKEAAIIKGQTPDMCSAYIALVHVDNPNQNGTAFTVDNTKMTTFPDWNTDSRVIAYAALPDADCVSTNEEWKQMNLVLDYKNTTLKPTHIIVVFAASKYGDYFTGSTSSKLYIDDLELVY